jgi:hypothetical protein
VSALIHNLLSRGSRYNWISELFKVSPTPPPYFASRYRPGLGLKVADTDVLLKLGYLQAEQLRRGLLGAYAAYAMQLMYNGGQAYTTQNGSRLTFVNPNATAFEPGPVIKPGIVPVAIPVTLFCMWALITSTLGIMYGFRRRWTETLDGCAMFQLGVESSELGRRAMLERSDILKKEDRVTREYLPALVRDTKPKMWLGRIELVKDVKADKKKLYEWHHGVLDQQGKDVIM